MADLISLNVIVERIFLSKGVKVMLDADFAELYGVTTKARQSLHPT